MGRLDELMVRADHLRELELRKLKQAIAATRSEFAEQRERLTEAAKDIMALIPERQSLEHYIAKFPWELVRDDGRVPTEIDQAARELRQSTTGGLNSIRDQIEKIDNYDGDHRHLPAREVGGILANATSAAQRVNYLRRQLDYWGERLEKRLPAAGYAGEAIEGEPPSQSGPIEIITNLVH